MSTNEKQYRVLHNLLENPIFLESLARQYETLTDCHTDMSCRIMHLRKIRDRRSKPTFPVMTKICEAYRIINERMQGHPDNREMIEIEQELLAPYSPTP